MSHIRHYQVFPGPTGLLTSPESIVEAPDRQVDKTGKSSILFFVFFLTSFHHISMTTGEAFTIQAACIIGVALKTYCYHRTQTIH